MGAGGGGEQGCAGGLVAMAKLPQELGQKRIVPGKLRAIGLLVPSTLVEC